MVVAAVSVYSFNNFNSNLSSADRGGVEKQDVIILFDGAPDAALVTAAGGHIKYQYQIIDGIAASLPAAAINALGKNPKVLSIEPDVEVFAFQDVEAFGKAEACGRKTETGEVEIFEVIKAGGQPSVSATLFDTATVNCIGGTSTGLEGSLGTHNGTNASGVCQGFDFNVDLNNASCANRGTIVAPGNPDNISRVNGGGVYTDVCKAWIFDTGIDFAHPDLTVDVGLSAFFGLNNTSPKDDQGHGTGVAGVVGGLTTGVAPGATLVSIKVLDRTGTGRASDVIEGIDYVIDQFPDPCDVMNLSFGTRSSRNSPLDIAVLNASAFLAVVTSAGNDSTDVVRVSPAGVNGPNIYTVSSVDQNDIFATFSNFGDAVDFAEPGVDILTTALGGGTIRLSGTSFSSPHLVGILLQQGFVSTDGFAINDPDGTPDPIGVISGAPAPDEPPVVTIDSPFDGDVFASGEFISFVGTALDLEDGDISVNLIWVSDLGGLIGNGGSFSTSSLIDGTHVIFASVEDSDLNEANAFITITVEPPAVP